MPGLLVLLTVAAVIVLILGTVTLVRAIVWPPRKTLAVALGRGDPSDPADLDLEAEAVTFTLTRGVQSPGWTIRGRAPTGPTVIIVHGHRDSRYGSLSRADRFAHFASRVVVFDLPAHGDACGGRCTLGADEPDDVGRVIEQLPNARVVLFGSSMGAVIALGAAAKYPQHVVGLILEGPFRSWRPPVVATLRLRRMPAFPFVPLAGLIMRLMGVPLDYDRAADAARLHCPLLLLHGELDPIGPPSSLRAIADAAPQCERVLFEGAGHQDLAQADEPKYRDALARFFAHLPA